MDWRSIHSKPIQTKWDPSEAMRLRQVLKDHLAVLTTAFYKDPEANKHPLVYNVHVQGINNVKELIRRIEEPLVEQGYLDMVEQRFLTMLKIGGSYSLSDPGGTIGDNPVGSGQR